MSALITRKSVFGRGSCDGDDVAQIPNTLHVSDVADRQADYVRCNDHCKLPKRLLN
jgi:hypothetical protein